MGIQEQPQRNALYFPPILDISISKEKQQVKEPIILFLRISTTVKNCYRWGLLEPDWVEIQIPPLQCELGPVV